ncbi:MAG: hypothetical protein H7Y01_10205 [Ferruginibacter sp.]|nr:hypothetical protein [Chitinophagaceae bacterium]
MYNYEVAPPAGAWEKIVVELDESALSSKFPSRLHTIEVPPPANAWQKIVTALDESALVGDYAAKLGGIAVIPPPAVWNKIQTSLQQEDEAAIPARRRISPFIKYAAAAVLLGLLAWGGNQLINTKQVNTTAKKETTTPAETPLTNAPVNLPDENIAIAEVAAALEEARNDAALEASKKTFAKLEAKVPRSKIKNVSGFFFAPDSYEPGTRGFDVTPEEIETIDIASRYIMLMTPDGNIIRMSKKLSNLVCCVSGEDEDKDCVDQMKKWRDKIANPSTGHSPGNFMEILKLANSLQDN